MKTTKKLMFTLLAQSGALLEPDHQSLILKHPEPILGAARVVSRNPSCRAVVISPPGQRHRTEESEYAFWFHSMRQSGSHCHNGKQYGKITL